MLEPWIETGRARRVDRGLERVGRDGDQGPDALMMTYPEPAPFEPDVSIPPPTVIAVPWSTRLPPGRGVPVPPTRLIPLPSVDLAGRPDGQAATGRAGVVADALHEAGAQARAGCEVHVVGRERRVAGEAHRGSFGDVHVVEGDAARERCAIRREHDEIGRESAARRRERSASERAERDEHGDRTAEPDPRGLWQAFPPR